MPQAVPENVGEFDYVIVGAGSAGCVLANRLSEDPNVRVCLLEAGGPDKDFLIHMPSGFAFMSPKNKINWGFETVPQKHMNGRRGYQPRGRTLGGSSSINAMIYIRGTKADYDGWASAGAAGWSYDDVLPYFKKAENNERGEDHWHGAGGPLNVADLRYKNPLSYAFLKAAAQLQLPATDDFNGKDQEGIGFYQVTQKDGRRCSTARAYIEPAKNRKNLEVISNAQAEKVLFTEKRADGVRFRQGAEIKRVSAAREVILSAGAFQSPQLLMLSGVGAASHLNEHGIEVVANSLNVGENLQEHVDYTILRKSKAPDAMGIHWAAAKRALPMWSAYKKEGRGEFTSNLAETGGFLKTDPSLEEPDIQLHFLPGIVDDHGRKKHLGGGFTCHSCVLRPKARGSVRLESSDPKAAPLIDPNLLGAPEDLATLVKGAKIIKRIFDAPALAEHSGQQMYLDENADDETLIEDIRNRADTVYHPVGTCRMGTDRDAVLDTQLRVNGVTGLRVVDASVMPNIISGNTNAPTIMISEKAADIIKSA